VTDGPGIVLDTGVVLQAALNPLGPAGQFLSLIDGRAFTVYLSQALLEEYLDVLRRPAVRAKNPRLTDELAAAIVGRIRQTGVLIAMIPHEFCYERDPDDEPVVNLAIAARARFLVSRDADLLDLAGDETFQSTYPWRSIVGPVDLLRTLRAEGEAHSEQ